MGARLLRSSAVRLRQMLIAYQGETFALNVSTKDLDIAQVQTIWSKISEDLGQLDGFLNFIRWREVSLNLGVVSRWDHRLCYAFLACQEAVNILVSKIEVIRREVWGCRS